jgi:hypothetical protein
MVIRLRLRLRDDRAPEAMVLRHGDLSLDLRTRRAEVEGRTVRVKVGRLDGEVVTRTPQDFSMAHNALKVLVPPESTAANRDLAG